jgi:hypothetical protein
MSTSLNDLRRNVFLCPNKRIRPEVVYAGLRIDCW